MKRHPMTKLPQQPNQTGPRLTQENMFQSSQWQGPRSGMTLGHITMPKFNSTNGADPQSTQHILQAPTNGLSSNVLLQQQMAAALLAQSMDSADEVSNSLGSDDLSVGTNNILMNNVLMNMNIPSAKFTKAFNFQTMVGEGLAGDVGIRTLDEEDENETLADEGSLAQHSFDTSSDLTEQQQCQQQSALMSKFRQLREWQQLQQEFLMTQQQSQLDMLRDEQERVQRMIAKQREMQWGATLPPPRNGFSSTMVEQITSLKPTLSHTTNTMAQTFTKTMQGELQGQMMGQLTKRGPTPLTSQVPSNNSAIQDGRPVPLFQASDRMTSQQHVDDTDSDIGSQHSVQENGVYPLSDQNVDDHHTTVKVPQWSSGGSGQHTGHVALGPYRKNQQHSHPDGDLFTARQQLQLQQHELLLQQQHQHPQEETLSAQLQQLLQQTQFQQQHQRQCRPKGPLSAQQQQQIQQLVQQQQQHQPREQYQKQDASFANDCNSDDDFVSASQNVSDDDMDDVKDNHMDFNHSDDALDFRETRCASQKRVGDSRGVSAGRVEAIGTSPNTDDHYYDEGVQGDGYYDSNADIYGDSERVNADYEEEDGQEYDDGTEEDCQCDYTEPQFDEMPVSGLGASKKTFEELLEEELRKEEERMQGSEHSCTTPSSKKQFLKRGEGMARFSSGGQCSKPHSQTTRPRGPRATTMQKPLQNVGPSSSTNGRQMPTQQISSRGGSTKITATTVTHGMPPKDPNMNRKVISTATEPTSKLPQDKLQPKPIQQIGQKPQTQPSKTPCQLYQQGQQHKQQQQQQQQQRKPLQQQKPLQHLQLNKPAAGVKKGSSSNGLSGVAPHPTDLRDTASKCSNADSLGETSFHARLTARAEEEEEDIEQLQEFELLEQFADDNASFLSNVSAVNRALQNTKGLQRNHKMPPIAAIVKPPPVIHSSVALPSPARMHESSDEDDDNDDTTVPTDFSTVTSQTSDDVQQRDDDTEHDNTLVESPLKEVGADLTADPAKSEYPAKSIHRKFAPTRRNFLASAQVFSDSDAELNKNQSDLSDQEENQSQGPFGVGMDSTGEDARQTNGLAQMTQGAPDGEANHRRSGEFSPQTLLLQSRPILSDHGDIEIADGNDQSVSHILDTRGKDYHGNDLFAQEINFEDDMEVWHDSRCDDPVLVTSVASGNPLITRSILSRETGTGNTAEKSTTPPTSRLVSKLFPKLRPEKPKLKVPPEAEQRLTAVNQVEPEEGVHSKLLRDKLLELEQEIEKFRSENTNLSKLRKEREEGLVQLKKEMAEFDKQKNEELKRLQDFKAEEMKKLRREKKQFEQFQQNARAMPNKKERGEIELLKTQLTDLQEEIKRKEARWNSSMSRLREKSETITAENSALRDEIKLLESKRLQAWQQRETAPKCKEDGSRPPPIKKSTLQPTKSPKPESQPSRFAPCDSALGLSTNLDLDESDILASEEPPPPCETSGTSPRQLETAFTPTPFHPESPISPPLELTIPENTKRQLPRKRATVLSLANTIDKGNEQYEEIAHPDGKIEKIYTNGAREILFTNGTRKQVSASGGSIIVSFFNGDMKQILPDQRIVYFYADAQTTHTTYPDGLEILQFPNQQVEKHYPDGTKEITFPDQTIKYLFPNGTEESIYADGTVIRIEKSGDKTVEFPNGQREVHTPHYKRREYPDGTVKTVYPDGKQETRYSSGRVRIKDNQGNVIIDKRIN